MASRFGTRSLLATLAATSVAGVLLAGSAFAADPMRISKPWSADGSRGTPALAIQCARADTGTVARSRPTTCVVFGPGGSFGGGVSLAALRWSSWGADTAVAHGIEQGFHLPLEHVPVIVTLSRIVTCGSRRFYTRVRATSHFGTTVAHTAGCPSSGDIGSPTAAPPANLFGSPSGNIICQAGPTAYGRSVLAYCQERAVNPYRDVALYVGGSVREGNGGGDPGETPIRKIAYGHSISWKGARCTSLQIGMRCVRTSTGHGFLINLAGIHRV